MKLKRDSRRNRQLPLNIPRKLLSASFCIFMVPYQGTLIALKLQWTIYWPTICCCQIAIIIFYSSPLFFSLYSSSRVRILSVEKSNDSIIHSSKMQLLLIILSTSISGFKGVDYRKKGCPYTTDTVSCIFRPEGNMPFFSVTPTTPRGSTYCNSEDF